MLLTYNGPHDGVEVHTPGRRVVVRRGGRADFPESVADSLLEQGENWSPASEQKVDKAPAAKPDNEHEHPAANEPAKEVK